MQTQQKDQEIEQLTCHFKSINFKATELYLETLSIKSKTVGLRIHSMLPQITISPRMVEIFATVARQRRVGVCTAHKYSPVHFLSLQTGEFQWADPSSLPIADYLLYVKPTTISRIIDPLSNDDKLLNNFLNSLEKIVSMQKKIELLDLCRTLIMISKDKISQKLLIRCEILFPYLNFLFTCVSPFKVISSSLTKRLLQENSNQFVYGFMTLDQSSRVVPLELSDSRAGQYPMIGVWVNNIPCTNSSSSLYNVVHPLVFAACCQFVLTQSIKEKISVNLATWSFLFLDFSHRPKFYEVSLKKPPSWRTTSYSKEVALETDNFPSVLVSFLKEDTRPILKKAVIESKPYLSHSSCNSRSCTPPTPKPAAHRMNPTYASTKDLMSPKSYNLIIEEQTKLIEKLQAQVVRLQNHVLSPKSTSSCQSSGESEYSSTADSQIKLARIASARLKSTKKIDFEEEMTDEMIQEKKQIYISGKFSKPGIIETNLKSQNHNFSNLEGKTQVKELQKKYLNQQ